MQGISHSRPKRAPASYTGVLRLEIRPALPCIFETHRLTLTTDMLYTLQQFELGPQLELIADLSHFVVGREFPWPVDEQHDQWVDRILCRSAGFQGRVARRELTQIAMDFPQHRDWAELFYIWWTRGMR